MARVTNRLSATKVAALKAPGMVCDGGGLYLRLVGASRAWIFRYTQQGRAHDMGLGRFPEVSLADARKRAFELRQQLAAGIDPLARRNAERDAARIAGSKTISFDDCVTAYIAAHESEWRSRKHAGQWRMSMATYASPVLGKLPVHAIDDGHVLRVLEPIWLTKTETASRVRGRIESTLDWARTRGYRAGENPARWRGHLEHQLSRKSKTAPTEHHRALPFQQIGQFMQDLRADSTPAARVVEFLALTATRSSEALNATWAEFNFDSRVWVIPGSRMKGGREHRVPLSDAALAVLRAMQALRRSEFVFPGVSGGRPLAATLLRRVVARWSTAATTVHGFRSTFRDWAAERTHFENHVVEMALAHALPSAVEAAYRRGDLFEKRAMLMAAWAEFCAQPSVAAGMVVPLRG